MRISRVLNTGDGRSKINQIAGLFLCGLAFGLLHWLRNGTDQRRGGGEFSGGGASGSY